MNKMKYLKKFEDKENDELFQELIDENPLSEDHDFYAFIASDDYKENEDGTYNKTLDIENMVRMTVDTYKYVNMMNMRTRFQSNSKLYHIWLPKFLRKEVDGKGSGSIPDYIIDIIDKYKLGKANEKGKRIFQEVKKEEREPKKQDYWTEKLIYKKKENYD